MPRILKSCALTIGLLAIFSCSGQSSSADVALNAVSLSPPTDLSVGNTGAIAFEIDADVSAEVGGCAMTESSDCFGTSYAWLSCRFDIVPVSLPQATLDYEFTSEQFDIDRSDDDSWQVIVVTGYLNSHSSGNGTLNDCLAAGEISFQANVAGEYVFNVTTELLLRTSFGFGEAAGASDEDSLTQEMIVVVE